MTHVLTYVDHQTGSPGYLAYDGVECRIAAGGCRVQPGLTLDVITSLAARMSVKQRILGVNVDGAKCGLDHDPFAADAPEVLRRFLTWMSDELRRRYSMGCDMGTRFEELEALAVSIGLPSVKYAIRGAQGLTDDDFHRRMRLLDVRLGRWTVGQRRAGHGLAHAVLTAARVAGFPARGLRVGMQGFGNLGRAAADTLDRAGAHLVAVSDAYGCVARPGGLDTARMLATSYSRPVRDMVGPRWHLPGPALFDQEVDVLVLAAGGDAVSELQALALPAPVVVVGANCGLSRTAEDLLTARGVYVVPDVIGGIGGSASMEALFGPVRTPSPKQVLDSVAVLVGELVSDVLTGSRDRGIAPTQVVADIAAAAAVYPDSRPYGNSPYRPTTDRRPTGSRVTPHIAAPAGGLS